MALRSRERTASFHERLDADEASPDDAELAELSEDFDVLTMPGDGDAGIDEDIDVEFDAAESYQGQVADDPVATGKKPSRTDLSRTVNHLDGLDERRGSNYSERSSSERLAEELAAQEERRRSSQFRLLLLGDSGVGKTSLMLRYSEDKFAPVLLSTAGVDFKMRRVVLRNKRVRLQIWDTAGQEKFHVITRSFYKGAHGICLVYSVTDLDSFNNVRYWMANIHEHASAHVRRIIVGNKSDLTLQRVVTEQMGRELADEFGDPFFETSALTGSNVAEAMQTLAEDIFDYQESRSSPPSSPDLNAIGRTFSGRGLRLRLLGTQRGDGNDGDANASKLPWIIGRRRSKQNDNEIPQASSEEDFDAEHEKCLIS